MTLSRIIGQAGGEFSMQWDNIEGAGIFRSESASKIVDKTIEEVRDYFCKLLEPYLGSDFRTAEAVIRNAE